MDRERQLRAEAKRLSTEADRIRDKRQSECAHTHAVQADSTIETWTVGCGGGTYSTGQGPARACPDCGLIERVRWGRFKRILPHVSEWSRDIPRVDHDRIRRVGGGSGEHDER